MKRSFTIQHKVLGQIIRKCRHRLGLTQEEAAERVGITVNFLGMVERGERNITIKNLIKISRGLNCPLAKLFKGIR